MSTNPWSPTRRWHISECPTVEKAARNLSRAPDALVLQALWDLAVLLSSDQTHDVIERSRELQAATLAEIEARGLSVLVIDCNVFAADNWGAICPVSGKAALDCCERHHVPIDMERGQ